MLIDRIWKLIYYMYFWYCISNFNWFGKMYMNFGYIIVVCILFEIVFGMCVKN